MSHDIYRLLLEITGIQTILIEIMLMIGIKITYPKSIVFISSFNVFEELFFEMIVVDNFFDSLKIYRIVKRDWEKRTIAYLY